MIVAKNSNKKIFLVFLEIFGKQKRRQIKRQKATKQENKKQAK